jgi:glycosyltransferase involved in cell wall biosynthesis
MHLLMVTETYPPEVNGVALTVQSLAQHSRAAGHRVTLVRPRQAPDGNAGSGVDGDEMLTRGLPIPRYPGLKFGLPAGGRLRQLIRDQHVDAVYVATEGPLGWSAVSAARSAGVPVVCGFHTRFDDYFRHYGAAFLQSTARAWMRRFHNRANCTLVPTLELKTWLGAQGFSRVELLRRAVDTERFDPRHRDLELRRQLGVPDCSPLVVHVGRLAPEKNLELVTAAFERIQSLSPGACMLWIGDGPSRAALQREHPRHRFPGVLLGHELARHFASADLFLFSSLTETFGNVTLEAMASGLTVCAFDYAAAHEHIECGVSGELAPFAKSSAFVRTAEKAALAWLKGKRLGQAARLAVEHLSPQRVADDFVQLLGGLMAKARPPGSKEKNHDVALHSTTV